MDWKDMLSQMKESLPEGEMKEEQPVESKNVSKAKKEKLSISMERKGRGGKTATIIYGFTSDDPAIEKVATELKKHLGIGGSARGGEILLQGDVREKVKPFLLEMGYRL